MQIVAVDDEVAIWYRCSIRCTPPRFEISVLITDLEESDFSGRYGTVRWCAYMCCLPLNSKEGIDAPRFYIQNARLTSFAEGCQVKEATTELGETNRRTVYPVKWVGVLTLMVSVAVLAITVLIIITQ